MLQVDVSPGVLHKRLLLARLLVQPPVCLEDLENSGAVGVLSGRVLDVGPEGQIVVCLGLCSIRQLMCASRISINRTVVVWADVEHACLTAGNGLGETEKCRSQGGDALRGQDLGSIQGWASRGDLDTVPVPPDACPGELLVVQARVVERELSVISLGRQSLQKNAATNIVNVLLAHEHGLTIVRNPPDGALLPMVSPCACRWRASPGL